VYRRHTNFALESIEQTFSGNADFGKKVQCTISRNGDLIHQILLQVQLPEITVTSGAGTVSWVKNIGHALINNVNLEIGGQEIDKQYGDWLHIWNELSFSPGHRAGFDDMIGNTPDLVSDHGSTDLPAKTLYVPLQFWFCRNVGLCLIKGSNSVDHLQRSSKLATTLNNATHTSESSRLATKNNCGDLPKPSNPTWSSVCTTPPKEAEELPKFQHLSTQFL
jgi:hypothetical protein